MTDPQLDETRYAVTDSRGEYTVMGLSGGLAEVTLEADDYLAPNRVELALTEGTVAAYSPELQAGAVMTGQVLSPTGAPVADALVELVQGDYAIQRGSSDASGAYRLGGVPAGLICSGRWEEGLPRARFRMWRSVRAKLPVVR